MDFTDGVVGSPMNKAATAEPPPKHNDHPAVADVVAADIISRGLPKGMARDVMARKAMGLKKYGTVLQPCNGRDNLNDLYQELVDAAKYAMTEYLEICIGERPCDKDYPDVLLALYDDLLDALKRVYILKGGDRDFNSGSKCGAPSTPSR